MSQRRIKFRKVLLTPDQLRRIDPTAGPFAIPEDVEMVDLITRANNRKIPVDTRVVPFVELRVHCDQSLAKIQAALLNNPWAVELMEERLKESPTIVVHRHDGALCMFDDYVLYAVAKELGVETIKVMVYGEGTKFLLHHSLN